MTWCERADNALVDVRIAGQYRAPRDLDSGSPTTSISSSGQSVISFASNDYLGLSQHVAVRKAATEAIERLGTGSGSARLIVGSRPSHSALEERIAQWRGTEAAVIFSSGFAANLGAISTFGNWASVICSDELNHASIIDGCRLSKAPSEIYGHRDVAAVNNLLFAADGPGIVVSDSVFSMDGDLAPVQELTNVCERHNALLILDDAHQVFAEEAVQVSACEVLRVGTLSKTLGSLGGYVCGPRNMIEVLINKARSYIFTTAGTPAQSAAAMAAINIFDSAEGDELKGRLRANIDQFRLGHPSPIIPIVVGEEERAVCASGELLKNGFLVPAIRPPTVPVGTSRLRLTLSALHTHEDVERLLDALTSVGIDAT